MIYPKIAMFHRKLFADWRENDIVNDMVDDIWRFPRAYSQSSSRHKTILVLKPMVLRIPHFKKPLHGQVPMGYNHYSSLVVIGSSWPPGNYSDC